LTLPPLPPVLALDAREGLPEDLQVLLARYPRDTWRAHANLGEMAQFWLQRHAMFRELGVALDQASGRFCADQTNAREFAAFFAPRLQFFLEQLHSHHHIEDDHYFPIFRAADAKLVRGFEMLDSDHHMLAACIADSVSSANDLLRAMNATPADLQRAAAKYAQSGALLLRGLMRHLDDEEDLIVPLILDRGEQALGVGH
jgi:hypothetical protein